jgi:uncharacterized protein YgiM (DUF1202 family)
MKKGKYLFVGVLLLLPLINCFGQAYLGWTTQEANLRKGPGTNFEIISTLKVEADIFIISSRTQNDFYNVIDIATNREGYVHKSLVYLSEKIEEGPSPFVESGRSSTDNPELRIYNNTDLTLTLKMNETVYSFNPKERKTITVNPGLYSYRASAPGVIPDIGSENLKGNMSYSWEFYIQTTWR